MFSVNQKREIADKIQAVLRATNHPELSTGEISFLLHVDGAESWSWADIRNNGAIENPGVNPWNEYQARKSSPEGTHAEGAKCPSCGSLEREVRMCMVENCGESHDPMTAFSSTHLKSVCSDSWHSGVVAPAGEEDWIDKAASSIADQTLATPQDIPLIIAIIARHVPAITDEQIYDVAEKIFGISVEAEHNRGPEWSVEVIAAVLKESGVRK